jgi:hypothetical protein
MRRYETAFFLQPCYQVEETDGPTASRPDPRPIKFTTPLLSLDEALRYKPEGRGFDSRCHWNFSLTKSFRPQYGPGIYSASNRNEYQEYFPGVKTAGTYSWQPYHLHVPIVLGSGSLNLLELSGPVQACRGIALHRSDMLKKVTAEDQFHTVIKQIKSTCHKK